MRIAHGNHHSLSLPLPVSSLWTRRYHHYSQFLRRFTPPQQQPPPPLSLSLRTPTKLNFTNHTIRTFTKSIALSSSFRKETNRGGYKRWFPNRRSGDCCDVNIQRCCSSSSSSSSSTTTGSTSRIMNPNLHNNNSTSSSTTTTTTGGNSTATTDNNNNNNNNNNNSKVKILFLGGMNDVNSVQQSIIKIQQLHSTNKVFDIAFSSVTSLPALQYLKQVYRDHDRQTNHNTTSSNTTNSNTTNVSMPIHLPILYLQDTNVTSSYIAKEQYQHANTALALSSSPSLLSNTDTTTTTTTTVPNETMDQLGTPSPGHEDIGILYSLEHNLYVLRPKTSVTVVEKDITNTPKNMMTTFVEDDPKSGIWNIPILQNSNNTYIVVASVPPYYRTNEHDNSHTKNAAIHTTTSNNNNTNHTTTTHSQLFQTIQHPSYIGCDVLISTEWPQGMEYIYQQQQTIYPADSPQNHNNAFTNTSAIQQHNSNNNNRMALLTSYDVADVALRARPRYHIAFQPPPPPPPSKQQQQSNDNTPSSPIQRYYQSPPFSHLTSTISTRQSIPHTGRFIAICPVPSTTATTTTTNPQMAKLQKFLHAISIVPLHAMHQNNHENTAAGVLPNPYTDVVYPVDDDRRITTTTPLLLEQQRNTNASTRNVGVSEASARRIIAESNQNQSSQHDPFRWSVGKNDNNKRTRHDDATTEVDPNNCTLFLYGLQLDRTGRLQNAARNNIPNEPNIILQTLHNFSLQRVRYPKRANPQLPVVSNYAFLDFPSHQHALKCLQHFQNASSSSGLQIMGIQLTLKWATPFVPPRILPPGETDPESKKLNTGIVKRLCEQDAQDSSTLYFKYTNWTKGFETIGRNKSTPVQTDEEVSTDIKVSLRQTSNDKQPGDAQKESLRKVPTIDVAGELLREWMEETLEIALADGGSTKVADRIRAIDEPALQVKIHLPKDAASKMDTRAPFCFFHFASHAAASMAIATLTGSTDGGYILEEQKTLRLQKKQQQQPKQQESISAPAVEGVVEQPQSTDPDAPVDALCLFTPNIGMYLHWTNDYVQPALPSHERDIIISEESGFKFARKHFPRDSRTDCWFCLASSACEKHLITGVYDTCYMTLPKGPVHPGHVLIVPVQHTSEGALKDASVTQEMEDLKMKLRHHASIAYNSDLFVFERAIQTRGGYHTHVQCIPIPRTLGLKFQSTLLAQGRKYGLDIREINTDLGLNAILSANDDNDGMTNDGGYFYAEVPMLGRDFKRFIHKVKTSTPTLSGRDRSGVNMQFGREVLALVMEDPKIAHWKSCQVDIEKEAEMAVKFRESFEKASNFLH